MLQEIRRLLRKQEGFQSSPAPRRGCCLPDPDRRQLIPVSILTRAEARVLRAAAKAEKVGLLVSILTRAEARVLPPCFGCSSKR